MNGCHFVGQVVVSWMYLASMRRTVMTRFCVVRVAERLLLAKLLQPDRVILIAELLHFGGEVRVDGPHEKLVEVLQADGRLAVVKLVEGRLFVLRAVPVHNPDLAVRGEPVGPLGIVLTGPVGPVLGGQLLAGPAELLLPGVGVGVVVGLEERILGVTLRAPRPTGPPGRGRGSGRA